MPAEVIECPACRHPVRVPESLFGQPVRCPECKTYFTAPTRDAEGRMGPAEVLEGPPAINKARSPTAKSPLFLPGLVLLLVGLCGVVVNSTMATYLTVKKTDLLEAMKKAVQDPNNAIHKLAGRQLTPEDVDERGIIVTRNICLTFLGLSLFVCAGAIAMLMQRWYWLAFLGSGIAVINIWMGCCLAGAPVGVWSLIKLLNPENSQLFSVSALPQRS